MATVRVAPKLSEGVAPSGSIRLDDLVKRYLVSIGAREFRFFTIPELSHFALLALYNVLRSRGLKDMDVEAFWKWARPNGTYSKVLLLPDTDEGQIYHLKQSTKRLNDTSVEETVVLQVDNVKQFTRKTFIRLLLQEINGGTKQKKIATKWVKQNTPSIRRVAGNRNDHALDEVLQDMRMKRVDADLEAVRLVKHRVEQTLDAAELRIIHLLFNGHKAQQVADVLGLDVKIVYKTQRAFTDRCKKLWIRLFGSSCGGDDL
jgi:hypothetical protein